jgi:serine protease Do
MRFKLKSVAAATAAVMLAGSAGAWGLSDLLPKKDAAPAKTVAVAPQTAPVDAAPIAPATVPNYRAIVERYGPAVVGVTVSGAHKVQAQGLPDDPFFQFFRGLPGLRPMPQGEVPFRGQGSGFIVSGDGLILTNAHVVRDAREVTVRLQDRREFTAKVLGSDAATDIAVLKIDARDLPTVVLGDPKQLQVGDYVLAIGAPFGLQSSATQGIVSAKGRSLPGDSYVPFIQTDAAVNPGNSGGPLFDASGRVVGINAQIYSMSGGFQGLAFAIPIDVALHVKDELVAKGRVDHARLGVTLQDLNQPLAESFGLKTPDGAVVSSVAPGSAASKAELKAGDVITRIDDRPVHTASDVSSRIGLASPGDKVKLTLWRDRASREIEVTLGKAAPESVAQADNDEGGTLGLAVRPLTRDEQRAAHTDHGLLVEGTAGAAEQAGIEPGDIVLALNGKPVKSVEQVRKALEGKPSHVALLVQRGDQRIFVPVRLS